MALSAVSLKQALTVIERECFALQVQDEEKDVEILSLKACVVTLEAQTNRQTIIIEHQNRRIAMLEQALELERGSNDNEIKKDSLSIQLDNEKKAGEEFQTYHKTNTQKQETIQQLYKELQAASKELSGLLESSKLSQAPIDGTPITEVLAPKKKILSKLPSLSEILVATKKVKEEVGPSEIPTVDKPSVPTILDLLTPSGSGKSWKKRSTDPRSPLRRSSSDNSVTLNSVQPPVLQNVEEEDNIEPSGMFNDLVKQLECDDSFLGSSPKKQNPTWKQLSTVRGHFDAIRTIAFHKTLPVLLSGSDDCTLKLWKIDHMAKKAQSESIHTYYGHTSPVLNCAMNVDSTGFFSASLDGSIIQWRLPKNLEAADPFDSHGKPIGYRVRTLTGHKDAVWDVCTHKTNSSLLFSASSDGSVKIWKPKSKANQCCYTVVHPSGNLSTVPTSLCTMNLDHEKLVIGYNDSSVCVLDIERGEIVQQMADAAGPGEPDKRSQINQIIAHPEESLLFTGHEDHKIRYFDTRTQECTHSMVGHLESVSSLSVDPKGKYLISGGHDSSVRVWDIRGKYCTQELMGNRKKFDESIFSVVSHENLNIIACCGADSNIKFLRESLPNTF